MNRKTKKMASILILICFCAMFSCCGEKNGELEAGYAEKETEMLSAVKMCSQIWEIAADKMKETGVRIADWMCRFFLEVPDNSLVAAWPYEVSRKNEEFTNGGVSLYVYADSPLQAEIVCETKEGRIDIQITDCEGEIYFKEEKMKTGSYIVCLPEEGEYILTIRTVVHTGEFTISAFPMEDSSGEEKMG